MIILLDDFNIGQEHPRFFLPTGKVGGAYLHHLQCY